MRFVYVLREEGNNVGAKIGKSYDPKCRLSNLGTGNFRKLTPVGAIYGDELLENYLHTVFENRHIAKEWYTFPEDDVTMMHLIHSEVPQFKRLREEFPTLKGSSLAMVAKRRNALVSA